MKSVKQLVHPFWLLNLLFFFMILLVYSSCTKDDLVSSYGSNHKAISTSNSRISFLQANAGNDTILTLPITQFRLDARQSIFPPNSINNNIIIEWRKLEGPNAALIESPNSTRTILSSLLPGVYMFEFSIQYQGTISRDSIQVIVYADFIQTLNLPWTYEWFCDCYYVDVNLTNYVSSTINVDAVFVKENPMGVSYHQIPDIWSSLCTGSPYCFYIFQSSIPLRNQLLKISTPSQSTPTSQSIDVKILYH